jgi:hypothetical protein
MLGQEAGITMIQLLQLVGLLHKLKLKRLFVHLYRWTPLQEVVLMV